MKSTLIYIALLLCAACHTSQSTMPSIAWNDNDSSTVVKPPRDAIGEYSPTTLIISYDAQVGKQPLLDAIEASGARVIYDYKMISGMAIKKPDNMTLDEAIAYFKKVKGVTHVERDRIIRLTDPVKPPVFDR